MKKRASRKPKKEKQSIRKPAHSHGARRELVGRPLHARGQSRARTAQHEIPPLPVGLQGSVERIVEFQWTIAAYNPDLPAIFSTPAMIGLMEIAAAKSLEGRLPRGTISVGTRIEVDHLKAAPQGATVRADARYVGNEGRFLIFDVEAHAGELLIGRGHVRRAIIPCPQSSAL